MIKTYDQPCQRVIIKPHVPKSLLRSFHASLFSQLRNCYIFDTGKYPQGLRMTGCLICIQRRIVKTSISSTTFPPCYEVTVYRTIPCSWKPACMSAPREILSGKVCYHADQTKYFNCGGWYFMISTEFIEENIAIDRIRGHIRALEGVRHPLEAAEALNSLAAAATLA